MFMNDSTLTTLFSSSEIRTVHKDNKNKFQTPNEIPFEFEPLESSKIYQVLPDFMRDNPVIFGFVLDNPTLDTHFEPVNENDYGNRYLIFRETANHFIVLFVSDNEKNMHFIRYEKDEIINLFSQSYHPQS